MMDFQTQIEELFSKNQLIPRIKQEFEESEFNFKTYCKEHKLDPDFGISFLVQMALHKRTNISTMVGLLRHHFGGDCQATTDALQLAVEIDLADWDPLPRQFICLYEITPDVQEDLDKFQYPLPMIVEPRTVTHNGECGFFAHRSSIILRDNHHDDDVCLDHINRINRIRLKINEQVALTIKNQWRNLDRPKEGETIEDYQKRRKAFEKYDNTTHDVLSFLGISNGSEFYLTHRYDKRGRTYCQGYHVDYQGTPWNKAVVEFANEEVTA